MRPLYTRAEARRVLTDVELGAVLGVIVAAGLYVVGSLVHPLVGMLP